MSGMRVKIELTNDHDDEVFTTEFVMVDTNVALIELEMVEATKQVLGAVEYYILNNLRSET